MNASAAPVTPDRPPRHGLAAALAAYIAWGCFPLYFKSIRTVPPLQILSHRVVWSLLFLAVLVSWKRRWAELRGASAMLPTYLLTTLLISANWLIFIWAVNGGRVLEASLGYFVNPLVNVLLGVLFLRERLSRKQGAAVALAGLGVLALVVRLGVFPWVSLALALTFGFYGLVRKKARIDAVVGLLVETALLAPVAVAFLLLVEAQGQGAFVHQGLPTTLLLASAGVVTAVPLIWFATGMKALRLSTMGVIQFITPTAQFLQAVVLFREPFTMSHAIAFGCIWASLALYTFDAVRTRRPSQPTEPALD